MARDLAFWGACAVVVVGGVAAIVAVQSAPIPIAIRATLMAPILLGAVLAGCVMEGWRG